MWTAADVFYMLLVCFIPCAGRSKISANFYFKWNVIVGMAYLYIVLKTMTASFYDTQWI